MVDMSVMSDLFLIDEYLADEASFWRNVQEPSLRVSDKALLCRLANLAYERFDNILVKSASVVVLAYRAVELGLSDAVSNFPLDSIFEYCISNISPEDGFDSCRWFLSLGLAEAAISIKGRDLVRAQSALKRNCLVKDIAYDHGQLFTNITKTVLLRTTLAGVSGYDYDAVSDLREVVSFVLGKSNCVALNYKFTNQYAYEEVAYVYAMMRQLYNWSVVNKYGEEKFILSELERAGYSWQCVGSPFKQII